MTDGQKTPNLPRRKTTRPAGQKNALLLCEFSVIRTGSQIYIQLRLHIPKRVCLSTLVLLLTPIKFLAASWLAKR
jgi:hypothetical protein